MHQLELPWVKSRKVYSCPSKVKQLFEKLNQACPSLMIDHRLRYQSRDQTFINKPGTKLKIFAHEGNSVASRLLKGLTTDPHVKATGMITPNPDLSASHTPGSEKRRHRVADSLLYLIKRRMRSIRTTKGIYGVSLQKSFDPLQIAVRQEAVRIKNNKEISSGKSVACVSCKALARIFLHVIDDIQSIRITSHNLIRSQSTPIFDYNYFVR